MTASVSYLDEPVIFEWTADRFYMEPLFSREMQEDPVDPIVLRDRLLAAISESIETIRENSQVIRRTLINNKREPPYHFERDQRMLFRHKEFLTKKYNEIMISKNNYMIEIDRSLYEDVFSLMRLIQVFPFVRYRIVLNDQTCQSVMRALKKFENDFDAENEESTRFLATILGRYENTIKKMPEEPAFMWPFSVKNETTQAIFDCYLICHQYDAVKPLIEQFTLEKFADDLEKAACILARRFKMHKGYYKDLTLFMVDFVFARIDIGFADLDRQYDGLDFLKSRKVCEFDLPKFFADPEDQDINIVTFTRNSANLQSAADELTCIMFEWSPTNMLCRVHRALGHVQNFIIERMKANGEEAPGFVPFDDTFSAFIVALVASNLANLTAVTDFACNIIDEQQLSNDFSFAQTTLRGSCDWIQSVVQQGQQ